MKYSTVILSLAVAALAAPQDSSPTTDSPTPTNTAWAAQISCALACDDADVTCKAQCMGVARPNESQVVDSTNCAMACDQGDGSPDATKKYGECQLACYASYFPSTQTLSAGQGIAPASSAGTSATGSAASGASQSTATGTSARGSGSQSSETGSPTESGSTPEETGAANMNQVKAASAGLVGLALAIFAL